ncbi:signal peptidase I [Adlercreutzia sp. ZJ138]|uniref:signal peptidase I n=1 Tax=Adlercreutzia sp. ZJ138 TaxID=2709405 RepID=UPI0013EBA86E|nr:signal peptidase I [Adlercreutzia sp. ZJ138]
MPPSASKRRRRQAAASAGRNGRAVASGGASDRRAVASEGRSDRATAPQGRTGRSAASKRRRKRIAAAVCNCAGILILISVIALLLPAVLPNVAGMQVLRIESGSMEPAIPVGSAVFVAPGDAADVVAGDIIAFAREDTQVVHRATANNVVEGAITTKGDANADEDLDRVPYVNYHGNVVLTVPFMGDFLAILTTTVGKVYLLAFAICGVLFNILATRLRAQA